MFDDAKKYVDNSLRTHWDRYFKVYRGKRVVRNYEGESDPVIREPHTIIETLVANIAGGDTQFHFRPTNEEQIGDTEVLNQMLDYYMMCNRMSLKNQEWVREMLLYGTAILHVSWEEGKPCIENIALRDFFVDPTSTGMVKTINPAQYAGYEYLGDIDTMKAQTIYDADKKQWVPRYNIPANIGKPNLEGKEGDHKAMDKAFKDMFAGSTLGEKASEKQIHIIRLYDLKSGRMVEIANRKAFIYNEPLWTQRKEQTREVEVIGPDGPVKTMQKLDEIEPFLPFVVLRDYIDSSQFYAEGEMALIMEDAELLNDYEAMQIDNNAYQNTPMYWIDPQYADLAPELETISGAVYPVPRNAMGALERPQLSGDLDNKQELILQRMRRATAADEAMQGGAIGNSRTTATEISTQMTQAQMRFRTKIQNLESEGYAQLGSIIFKMVQIFVTQKTAIRIVGKMGIEFKDFDPWEFNGEYEVYVKLDSTIKQDQVEVGLREQAVFDAMKGSPLFDQVELTRWWVQRKDPNLTDEQFNNMLAKGPIPPTQEEELRANSLIEKARLMAIAQMYDVATPFTQMQIEMVLGLQGDPAHLGDAHNKMLEQANTGADHMDPATRADGSIVPGLENMITPPAPAPQASTLPAA